MNNLDNASLMALGIPCIHFLALDKPSTAPPVILFFLRVFTNLVEAVLFKLATFPNADSAPLYNPDSAIFSDTVLYVLPKNEFAILLFLVAIL